jgi:CheY-like chemotaxis protein
MAKTILVADDNKHELYLVQVRLEEAGYKVLCAKDGEEAIGLTQENKPDLLILDVRMPKLDGDQVYMMLKSDPATKHIPILILTGLRSDAEIASSHEEDIFAKPVNFETLKARLKQLLGE